MKTFKCSDVGYKCDTVIDGGTEDEVLNKASEHGRQAHGLKEMTNDLKDKVRSAIKGDNR